MKPLQHAQISAHRYGGTWADWIAVHSWIDQSKAIFASMQHRMLLHSDFGAWLAPRVLGELIWTADKTSSARTIDLFNDHQLEDLGRTTAVPLAEWLREAHAMPVKTCRPPRALEGVRDSPAEGLAARWGGVAADYHPLIQFFDLPAQLAPEYKETAAFITHSSFGIFLAEQLLGITLELSPNPSPAPQPQPIPQPASAPEELPPLPPPPPPQRRLISTRSAAEDLVQARTGWIPSAGQLPARTRLRWWMRGAHVREALRARLIAEQDGAGEAGRRAGCIPLSLSPPISPISTIT